MRYKSLPLSVRATPRPERGAPPRPRSPRRLRDWLATIPIVLLLPALVLVGERAQAGSPTLTLPATATAGATLTVTGAGFQKNAHLQLVWDGAMDAMPATRANVSGNFAIAIVVPQAALPGPHTVAVVDRPNGNGRDVRAAAAAVMASAAVEVLPPDASQVLPSEMPVTTVAPTPMPTIAVTAAPSATPQPTPTALATAKPTPVPTPAPTSAPLPAPPASATSGIWLSSAQIMALPTSGGPWSRLVARAASAIPPDDLSCQDASAPGITMATALVAARTNDNVLRSKVRDELMRIMGTEAGSTCGHPDRNRPLGVGRNLTAYVISADLIGFRAFDATAETTWRAWLSAVRSTPLPGGWALNSATARDDHSNWGAHQAAALTAADAYLGDASGLALDAAWARAWVDPTAPMPWAYHIEKHDYSWSATGTPPGVPVNPAGAMKDGVLVDGIPLVDMQRGGGFTTGAPVLTDYPREALVGRTVQFELLWRAGYPSYSWGSNGLLRVAQRLLAFSQQWDPGWYDARINAYWILSARYGVSLPRAEPAVGRQVVGADWTHRAP